MSYELQAEPVSGKLAALGGVVELRELPYGVMREVMASGDKPGQSADRLLGAALHVDGVPLGYEALEALPGRFSGAIAGALQRCMVMHGLTDDEADDESPKG